MLATSLGFAAALAAYIIAIVLFICSFLPRLNHGDDGSQSNLVIELRIVMRALTIAPNGLSALITLYLFARCRCFAQSRSTPITDLSS
ncbi:hypothetical protein OH77DRAFT_1524853 [Trametes cingulata]|nr:hypothetical protein OH77DRAFT_1524853 [Trametes cingulata]